MDKLDDLLDELDDSEMVGICRKGKYKNSSDNKIDHDWNYCNFKINLPDGYWNTSQYPNGDPVLCLQDSKGNSNYFRLPQHRISLFEHIHFDDHVDLAGGNSYEKYDKKVDIKNKRFKFYYEDLYINNQKNIKGNRDFVHN